MPGSNHVRDALEHRPRNGDDAPPGAWRVDPEAALGALQLTWGDAYRITVSTTPPADPEDVPPQEWRAVRHDRPGEELTASTADDLNHWMRADWGLDQARLGRLGR